MKKRAIVICLVLIGVALAAAVVLLFSSFTLFGYQAYTVTEPSEGHKVPEGSLVIIDEGQYHLNQPVRLSIDGKKVTHGLTGFELNGTTDTQGYANPGPDPWHVPKSQIDGGVVWHAPLLGSVILFIRTPFGIVTTIVASVLTFFLVKRMILVVKRLIRKSSPPMPDLTEAEPNPEIPADRQPANLTVS